MEVPDDENCVPCGPALGRPRVDYRSMYLSLEKRCKRAGLSLDSNQPFKKQMLNLCSIEVGELSKQVKEKDKLIEKLEKQKRSNTAMIGIRRGLKPYSQKSSRRQRQLRSSIEKIVVANSTQPARAKASFVKDFVRYSLNKVEILESLNDFFEDKKIASIIQDDILNKATYRVSRSELVRTRDFVERKRMQISRSKRQKSNKVQAALTVKVSSQIAVESVVIPCTSKTDKAARCHLRRAFPLLTPSAMKDENIKVEHALIDTVAMIKCCLCNFFSVEELGENWVWFYSARLRGYKFLHVELSTFYDSTPFGKDGDSCTGLYIRFINAPGLVQKPEFTYILYLCKTKETSALAESLLRRYSYHLVKVLKAGIKLVLDGFGDDMKIPNSTIPLNGTHSITFGCNNFAADGKAQLWAGGCKGANSTYTPEYSHHKEEMVNPNFPVNMKSYITLPFRKLFYNQIDQFKQLQRAKFNSIAKDIKTDKSLPHKDKTRKLVTEYQRLMITSVRAEAIRIHTGCLHIEPFDIAEQTTPCPLHMDTNEYLRVLVHIVKTSANLTLDHFCTDSHSRFQKFSGRGKANGSDFPDISKASPESPLAQVIEVMRRIKMNKFAKYFVEQYTPPANQSAAVACSELTNDLEEEFDLLADLDAILGLGPVESSQNKDSQRLRMIGENIKILSPHFISLVLCLRPTNGIWADGKPESQTEFKNRIVCHIYVHLLRSLSAMLSTWIITLFWDEHGIQLLGDMYVMLVHRFKLHKSYNTFLFAQVSPFKVKQNMFRYQLDSVRALNIGLYGKNEGGEGNQKIVKEHYKHWTDKKAGAFISLIDQTIEVYLCGTNLFPETCPGKIDLVSENKKSWAIRFGSKNDADCCHACRIQLQQGTETLMQALQHAHFSHCHDFTFTAMHKHLCDQNFQYSQHKSILMFQNFLHIEFDKKYCDECVTMAQVLFALYSGKHALLHW